jgi:hypothetical protein
MEDSERPPPPDAVAVTADGALCKLVLQEGTGEMPPKHARCLGESCSGAGDAGGGAASAAAAACCLPAAGPLDRWPHPTGACSSLHWAHSRDRGGFYGHEAGEPHTGASGNRVRAG